MHRRFGFVFVSFVSLALPVEGVRGASRPSEDDWKEAIERAVHEDMEKTGRVGLSLGVVRDGELILARGYGFADLEHEVPAKPETMYRLASISKTFTAVAALRLVEKGLLDLDVPVQQYVPNFPDKRWPITTRQLLGHLAGIRHYRLGEIWSAKHYVNVEDPLEIFRDDPLLHEPGTAFRYTTYGYNLLGAAIARAADGTFLDVLRESIFEPAGMVRIRDDHVWEIVPNRARGYRKDASGKVLHCMHVDTSNKIPGGGLLADVRDLARYAIALMEGSLLRPETRTLMWTEQTTNDGRPTGYGLGWKVRRTEERLVVHHTGGQPGTSTALLLWPDQRIAVIALSNLEGASPLALARDVARIVERSL